MQHVWSRMDPFPEIVAWHSPGRQIEICRNCSLTRTKYSGHHYWTYHIDHESCGRDISGYLECEEAIAIEVMGR